MKLKSSKKDKAEKKQAQEQYPKVKTFSRAYDYSPASKEAPAAAVRNTQAFLPDERPYPVVSESVPVSAEPAEDYNDPERIDLQDTLLTDESFVQRVPHRRPPVSDTKAEEKIAVPAEEPAESEESEPLYQTEPEAEFEADSFPGFESYAGLEPEPDPDSEPDSDFFYMPDSDEESEPEPAPVFESNADLPAEADEEPAPADSDAEAAEPFSWFGTETDLPETPDEDDRSIAFKKKKYSVEVGKKTNLKKKLASRPRGSLKWKSSDKKIAKVSKKGILKPKKKGKVTVRVKTKDGEKAKVRIRIRSANKVKTIPWETVGSGKKKSYEKKWSIFA